MIHGNHWWKEHYPVSVTVVDLCTYNNMYNVGNIEGYSTQVCTLGGKEIVYLFLLG